jgi:hypothetical protein
MVNVFGKREIEVLAIELLDRGLLEQTFTKEQAIASDPAFLHWEGFDYAVELKWLEASVQRPGVFRCSRAFIERTKNAHAKDQAEGRL